MRRVIRAAAFSVLVGGLAIPRIARVQEVGPAPAGASEPPPSSLTVRVQGPDYQAVFGAPAGTTGGAAASSQERAEHKQKILADAAAAEKRGDYAEAFKLLLPLAESGNIQAEVRLAGLYLSGQGVPQNTTEAARWFGKAADQGDAGAQLVLGTFYRDGSGVPRDDKESAKWFRRAAEQDDAFAQDELAGMYYDGRGVAQNLKAAAAWWWRAAEHGLASAQFQLGLLYDIGRGVPKDAKEAAKWYRLAGEQGDVSAQFDLGLLYDEGRGVPQSYNEAAKWYRRAADRGDASAQNNLGLLYRYGQGVRQDFVLAYMWLNLAAVTDDKAPHNRDQLATIMTPQQIAGAQQLSSQWRPSSSAGDAPWEKYRGQQADADASASTKPVPSPVAPKQPATALFGSGFFIAHDGRALTNAHVVDGCKNIRVASAGESGTARLLARDPTNDLAFLATTLHPASVAVWRSGIRQGEDIAIYGFPLVGLLTDSGNITTGTVAALAGPAEDSRLLQITAPVQPGNSGGPVLDRSGNVVGIVAAKLDALGVARATHDIPENVGFAIKASVVAGFLDGWQDIPNNPPATVPLATPDIATKARAFMVRIECDRQ